MCFTAQYTFHARSFSDYYPRGSAAGNTPIVIDNEPRVLFCLVYEMHEDIAFNTVLYLLRLVIPVHGASIDNDRRLENRYKRIT